MTLCSALSHYGPISEFRASLVPMFEPLVTVLVFIMGLLGLMGLIAPDTFGKILRALTISWICVRLIGALLVLAGAAMLLTPQSEYVLKVSMPLITFVFSVLTCLKGLFWLLFPGLVEYVAEFHDRQSKPWRRFLGVICLAAAILLYAATIQIPTLAFFSPSM